MKPVVVSIFAGIALFVLAVLVFSFYFDPKTAACRPQFDPCPVEVDGKDTTPPVFTSIRIYYSSPSHAGPFYEVPQRALESNTPLENTCIHVADSFLVATDIYDKQGIYGLAISTVPKLNPLPALLHASPPSNANVGPSTPPQPGIAFDGTVGMNWSITGVGTAYDKVSLRVGYQNPVTSGSRISLKVRNTAQGFQVPNEFVRHFHVRRAGKLPEAAPGQPCTNPIEADLTN